MRTDETLAGLCRESWSALAAHDTGHDARRQPRRLARYALRPARLHRRLRQLGRLHVPAFLETARALTQAAHEALGGAPGTRPLVVDPFAGGGSIPLEALRVGADAFASDLNPVAVLLNKVVLEYIPKYGQRLADEVRKGGRRGSRSRPRRIWRSSTLKTQTVRRRSPTCGRGRSAARGRVAAPRCR